MALSWFDGLTPGSVSYFQDLTDRFISQFITSRMERRTSIHLSKIKQGPQESLAEFVKRFHQEVALIPDLEDGATYTSFLNELKNSRFKLSLAEQKKTSLAETLRKAFKPLKSMLKTRTPRRELKPKEIGMSNEGTEGQESIFGTSASLKTPGAY